MLSYHIMFTHTSDEKSLRAQAQFGGGCEQIRTTWDKQINT